MVYWVAPSFSGIRAGRMIHGLLVKRITGLGLPGLPTGPATAMLTAGGSVPPLRSRNASHAVWKLA